MQVVHVAAALAALLTATVGAEGRAAGQPGRPALAARAKKKPKAKPKPPVKEEPPAAAPAPTPAPAPSIELPAPPALPNSGAKSVAVLPLVGIDVDEELRHAIEIALVREVDEAPGMRAISPSDVQSDLASTGLTTACEDDVLCLARAGRYARAHFALASRIAAIGGTLNVSMSLVDTVAEVELTRVADPVSEEAGERAQELHRLAVQLLSPDSYVGALTIKCPTDGAEVYLDDKLVGATPLAKPITGLRAGPHILRISKAGFSDLYRFVDVVYKRSSTIEVDLSANTIAGLIVEEVSSTGFGSLFIAAAYAGIEIRVDGEPRGVTILDGPIEKVAAGKRRLSLHREGSPAVSQEIEITAGQRTDVTVEGDADGLDVNPYTVVSASAPLPEPAIAAVDPGAPSEPELRGLSWRVVAGLALAGVGAASLGVAGYYGNEVKKANARTDEIVSEADETTDARRYARLSQELEENNDRGQSAQTKHVAALVGGSIAAASGAALVLWDLIAATRPIERGAPGPAPSVTESVRLGVQPLEGGATLLLGGRF